MWLIEKDDDFKKGGFVKWKAPFKLKHFITGNYFSVKKRNNELVLKMREKPNSDT